MSGLNHKLLDRVMGLTPSEKKVCACGHRDFNHQDRSGHCTYWINPEKQCDCAKFTVEPAKEAQ